MRSAVVLLLASAAWAAPSVSANPDRVVLGRDRAVELTAHGQNVLGSASTGALVSEEHSGDTWHFTWTPPESGSPRTAVLLFWEASASRPEVAIVRVPMIGRTELAVETEPNAEVVVTLEGKTFGPRQADAHGHVKVPVEVPPGAKGAKVSAQVAGRTTNREVAMPLPPDREVAIALGPQPMDATGGWALAVASRPVPAGQLSVSATGASTEPLSAPEGEAYRVTPEPGASTASVTARLGSSQAHASAAVVSARPPPPSTPLFGQARPSVEAGLGYFSGGGVNTGLVVRAGVELGPLIADRVFAELLLGYRHTSFDKAFAGLGTLHSGVSGFPIVLAARVPVFERGTFGLDGRAGLGLLPFRHSISSTFGADFSESKMSWIAMLAVDARLRFGNFEPLIELQGALAPTKTDRVDANLGGFGILIGARYHP